MKCTADPPAVVHTQVDIIPMYTLYTITAHTHAHTHTHSILIAVNHWCVECCDSVTLPCRFSVGQRLLFPDAVNYTVVTALMDLVWSR